MKRLGIVVLLASAACADPLAASRLGMGVAKAGQPEESVEQSRDRMLAEQYRRDQAKRQAYLDKMNARREKRRREEAKAAAAREANERALAEQRAREVEAGIAEAKRKQATGEDLQENVCGAVLDILAQYDVIAEEDRIAKATGATNVSRRYEAGQRIEELKAEIEDWLGAWKRRYGKKPNLRTWMCSHPDATRVLRSL